MRGILMSPLLVWLCEFGCSRQPDSSQTLVTPKPPAVVPVQGTPHGEFLIASPVSHKNLTIFPVLSRTPKNEDRFITLDEGLAAGTVKIVEVGAVDENAAETANASLQDDPFAEDVGDPFDEAEDDPFAEDDGDPFAVDDGDHENRHDDETFTDQSEDTEEEEADSVGDEGESTDDEDLEDLFAAGAQDTNAASDQYAPDGDVNQLLVYNTSSRPLYLMPGEVISGGKQDRTIAQELVIAPGEEPVPIEVFCVEQGRWNGRSVATVAAQLEQAAELSQNSAQPSIAVSETLAFHDARQSSADVAARARRGEFIVSVGQLSKDVRVAVQDSKDQGAVWDEVSVANAALGNAHGAGSFAENFLSGEVAENFEPYVDKLNSVGETEQIVGVVVAVNGKMICVDIFESTPLFCKFWPKLLKSYAVDAVADEEAVNGDDERCDVDHCIAFLRDVENAEIATEELDGGQKIAKRESANMAGPLHQISE